MRHRCTESCWLFPKAPHAIREFMRTDAGSRLSFTGLSLLLALALPAGCGGGSAVQPGAANNANGQHSAGASQCDLSAEAVAQWRPSHVEGSRVLVPLPAEVLLAEGNVVYVVPACSVFLAVVEAPPAMANDPAFITANMADLQTTRPCTARGEGIVCQETSGVLVARPLRAQGAAAVVMATAPTEEQANRLVGGMHFDLSLPFDAVHALGVTQPPPAGMALHPVSQTHILVYAPPGANPDDGATPTLIWSYQTGTDHEIGEQLGAMAVQQLGVSGLGAISPVGESTEREIVLTATGMHGALPVTVVMGLFRQQTGAFVFIARVPTPDAAIWIQRIQAQTAATQTLR